MINKFIYQSNAPKGAMSQDIEQKSDQAAQAPEKENLQESIEKRNKKYQRLLILATGRPISEHGESGLGDDGILGQETGKAVIEFKKLWNEQNPNDQLPENESITPACRVALDEHLKHNFTSGKIETLKEGKPIIITGKAVDRFLASSGILDALKEQYTQVHKDLNNNNANVYDRKPEDLISAFYDGSAWDFAALRIKPAGNGQYNFEFGIMGGESGSYTIPNATVEILSYTDKGGKSKYEVRATDQQMGMLNIMKEAILNNHSQ